MQRLLAIAGILLPLTWRPADPTRLARAAQRVPTWAAYIAGGAALAITAGAILGPAIGVVAEPYGSVGEYFEQSVSAGVFVGGWIGAIAMLAGAIVALSSFVTPPRHWTAAQEDVVWFGPLPHIRICLLALVPLTAPALLYSAVIFVTNLNSSVLVAPPAAFAWTQDLPPLVCLLFLAVPIYYAALVATALHRLGRLESGAACIHCGYPTRGLPAPRCPECGRDPEADDG